MNVVGTLSAVYQFDHNGPLQRNGLSQLNNEQLLAFEPYWFQEANPAQEAYYGQLSEDNAKNANFSQWRNLRETYYFSADANNDGVLNKAEAFTFLR